MNTNFESLPLLNNYLNSHIGSLEQCEDKHAEVNHLIQVMRQNEGLLKGENTLPDALVKFLKSVTSLKEVEAAENEELTQVTSAAMSVFTHLGKDNIDSSLNAIHQLKEVGSEIFNQTLADWIAEGKVHITSLHLSPDEILKLAPYLTYLSIDGNEYSDEFIGDLLENTKKLKTLTISSNNMEGHAFARFKNTEHLQSVIISGCPNFNQSFPTGMRSLNRLVILDCPVFNQPLPQGLDALTSLMILECPSFNPMQIEGMFRDGLRIIFEPKDRLLESISSVYEVDNVRGVKLANSMHIDANEMIEYSLSKKFPMKADLIATWMKEEGFFVRIPTMIAASEVPFLGENSVKNDPLLQLLVFQIFSHCLPTDKEFVKRFLAPFIKNPELLAPFTSKSGGDALYEHIRKCFGLNGKDKDAFLTYLNETKTLPNILDYNTLLAGWIAEKKIPLRKLELSALYLLELAPHLTYLNLEGFVLPGSRKSFTDEFIGDLLAKTENLTELRIIEGDVSEYAFAQLKNIKKLQNLCIESLNGIKYKLPADMSALRTLVIQDNGFNQPLPPVMPEMRELHITSSSFNQPLPEWVGGLRKLTINCPELTMSLPTGLGAMEELIIHACKGLTFDAVIKPLLDIYKSSKERGFGLHVEVRDGEDVTVISSRVLMVYEHFIDKNPADADAIIATLKKIEPETLRQFLERDDIPLVKEASLNNDPLQQLYLYNICKRIPNEKIPLLGALASFVKTPMEDYQKTCYEQIAKFDQLESFLTFIGSATPLPELQDKNSYYQLLAAWMTEKTIPIKSLHLTDEEMFELAPHLTYLDLTDGDQFGKNQTLTDDFVGTLLEKTEHLTHLKIAFSNIDGSAFARFKNTEHLDSLLIASCDNFNYPLPDRMPKLDELRIKCLAFNQPLPESLDALRTFEIYSNSYNHPLPEWVSHLEVLLLGCLLFNHPLPSKMDNLSMLRIDGCSALNQPLPVKLDNLKVLSLIDSELFNQPLPERLDNLSYLQIKGLDVFNQPLPKGMSALQRLTITESKNFNQPIPEGMATLRRIEYRGLKIGTILRFLLPILRSDREHAFVLATGLLPRQQKDEFAPKDQIQVYEFFIEQHLDQIDAIAEWVEKIRPETLLPVMQMNASENIIPVVEGDPLQTVFLHGICTKLPEDKIPLLKPLLEQIVRTPMDPPLQQFYERFLTIKNPGDLLQSFITASPSRIAEITSRYHQDREKLFKFLPFLIHVDAEKNLNNLDKTGQLDLFLDKFSYGKEALSIMATEDLFTEDGNENAKTIKLISDLETEFNNLKNTISIPGMPWAKEAESLAQTPVGRAFIKLHFHEIVKEPQLQEIILRAFPPSQPENLALYPMESQKIESLLEVHVVPTLPIADASRILKTIVSNGDLGRIKIYYYGSPGADASGLGRQFVSEVIQGYVINQESLFIRTLGGEMYPYDPTHRLGPNANRESYKALGLFLGLVLKWQYPTGKVLSEKALNCMLAFSQEDLMDDHFDVGALVAKMDPVAFIKFMREATIEDEESVKLYEQVFLSEDSEVVLKAARNLNDLLGDEELDALIAGGYVKIVQIQERLRAIWVEDQAYSLSALHAMAQGMMLLRPNKIGDREIVGWEDVRNIGAKELSKHLQGELTPQYVKEHIHVRVMLGETPEKRQTADNVRKWTDEWIDSNGNDPEKLANFVQAFSGARAMTKDILLDINPHYLTIEAHTCFNRCDIPVGVKEGFLKLMWDDYATGNFQFNKT